MLRSSFGVRHAYDVTFLDGKYYKGHKNGKFYRRDIVTNEGTVFLDLNEVGYTDKVRGSTFSPDRRNVLLKVDSKKIYRRSALVKYRVYIEDRKEVIDLADGGWISYPTFSPDSKKVAYVQDNNLFYYDLTTDKTVQITQDGEKGSIINGSADWVYEEEFRFTKAFSWSPDSLYLAYYRFDESEVREHSLQHFPPPHRGLYTETYGIKYPKPGEDNAIVEIYVYALGSGQITQADTGDDKEVYITGLSWAKPGVLSIQRLNRAQNHWTLLHADPDTGKSRTILEEKSDAYVDVVFCDELVYVQDGRRFVMSSERSGYKHFYLHNAKNGALIKPITKGEWEAYDLVDIHEKGNELILYYMSTELSHLERHLYSVSSRTGKKKRITQERGVHLIKGVDPTFTYYLHEYSSTDQTPRSFLRKIKTNELVKEWGSLKAHNEKKEKSMEEYGFTPKEMFTFSSEDNQLLYGYFIKPPDFDPNNKYPVLIFQYSGPGGFQKVMNAWGDYFYTYHQLLAQNGYIVAVIDPRGTSGRGRSFKHITYGRLGQKEVEDYKSAAVYLGTLPYVDKDRLGIWGWSYGGYMAALVLLRLPGYYKMAISSGGVYSWRLYDSIYTERYLGLPQDNPEGYDQGSPLTYAKDLQGNLLIIHGMEDDNVHFQHAATFHRELTRARKNFTPVYYPYQSHALGGVRPHLFQQMVDYIYENL